MFNEIKSVFLLSCRDLEVSFETQDLIREMLEVNYKKRLTANQVRTTLDNMLTSMKKKIVSTNQTVPSAQPDSNGEKVKGKSVIIFKFKSLLL